MLFHFKYKNLITAYFYSFLSLCYCHTFCFNICCKLLWRCCSIAFWVTEFLTRNLLSLSYFGSQVCVPFHLTVFKIFFLPLIFNNLIIMCLDMIFLMFILLDVCWAPWISQFIFFIEVITFFYFFKYFLPHLHTIFLAL